MTPGLAQTQFIDINCDLGEGKTIADCEKDAQLMPFISRCNIACGGHAGNKNTMLASLKNAKVHSILAGAHPGYPDKENFGRLSLSIEFAELANSLVFQINQLKNFAAEASIQLNHIKCHGALYNDAEKDPVLANRLVNLFTQDFPELTIMGLANGEMEKSCKQKGFKFLREGFMDRAYQDDGKLVTRSKPDSVYDDVDKVVNQACQLAQRESIQSYNQNALSILVDSICLHGDNQNAITIAQQVCEKLKQHGIRIGQ